MSRGHDPNLRPSASTSNSKPSPFPESQKKGGLLLKARPGTRGCRVDTNPVASSLLPHPRQGLFAPPLTSPSSSVCLQSQAFPELAQARGLWTVLLVPDLAPPIHGSGSVTGPWHTWLQLPPPAVL